MTRSKKNPVPAMLAKRSQTPPWPGIAALQLSTFVMRLNRLFAKSPQALPNPTDNATPRGIPGTPSVPMHMMPATPPTNWPNTPSHDLRGFTDTGSAWYPNARPAKKATTSDSAQAARSDRATAEGSEDCPTKTAKKPIPVVNNAEYTRRGASGAFLFVQNTSIKERATMKNMKAVK